MSENLDLVRSIFAAREQGDYSSVGWADPDIEYVVADGPEPGTWRGLAKIAESWRELLTAWQDHRSLVDEYRELADGRVLVLGHSTGRGKTSGVDLSALATPWANVIVIRDGKVTRIVLYNERARALADLGLAE
jgi:ketosteroid isomerase-like protein